MAQTDTTNGASAGMPAAAAQQPAYQLIVNTQYLKDLSFESPRAPQTLMAQREAPEVNLTADVKARSLGPEVFEVVLNLGAHARHKEEPVFVVELSYAAVVTVKDAPADLVPLLVFVETPRLLFPFARAVIANATRDGGFPPLLINPIDFAELLRREHERALKEQTTGGIPQPTAQA
ncbi:MAG TPA: protein-export chaperone SecB [Stellaceae bacterium]|nr:protein-export chaperone SecB [Stellaceae bacterium]